MGTKEKFNRCVAIITLIMLLIQCIPLAAMAKENIKITNSVEEQTSEIGILPTEEPVKPTKEEGKEEAKEETREEAKEEEEKSVAQDNSEEEAIQVSTPDQTIDAEQSNPDEKNMELSESDVLAPTAPGNLLCTEKTDTSISLAWEAATDNVSVAGYEIYEGTNLLTTLTETSYTATELEPGTEYSFTVKAYDTAGNKSEASNQLTEVTILGVPSNIAVSTTMNSITLTWDAVLNATSYEVEADGVIVGESTATCFEHLDLQSGIAYTYHIRAKNNLTVSEWSSEVIQTTLLDKPANLQYALNGNQITLTWDAVEGAISYTIYRNNEPVGQVNITSFIDSNLMESIEYVYEVAANDAIGNMSSKSDPVNIIISTTLEPVYINSDLILDSDKTYDDLSILEGTVDLNGYKLTVEGNLIQSGGTMYINGGALEVMGDYRIVRTGTVLPNAYLKMVNETDYIQIWGDFFTEFSHNHTDYLKAGIIELKGNYIQQAAAHNPNGTHKVILSGENPQTVSASSTELNCFNILEMNNAANITFSTPIVVNTITGIERINSTSTLNLKVKNPLLLTHDTLMTNLILNEGTIDLNGNKLITINTATLNNGQININNSIFTTGHLNINEQSVLDVNGGFLTVETDLIQNGGLVDINGGKLEVLGDYWAVDNTYNKYLKMTNETDHVKIWGDFLMESRSFLTDYFTAGVLEIKGDVTDTNNALNNLTGSHKVILNGDKPQTITAKYSRFNILEINQATEVIFNSCIRTNTLIGFEKIATNSSIDIEFSNTIKLLGNTTINGCLTIDGSGIFDLNGKTLITTETFTIKNGKVDINGGLLEIKNDLVILQETGTIDLHGGNVFIKGNILQYTGTIDINNGNLETLGDYITKREDYNYANACLKMTNETDHVKVWGSFLYNSNFNPTEYLSEGTLEVKGDITIDYYFPASGNHKIVLTGENLQTVNVDDANYCIFNILEIDQATEVIFQTKVKINTLIGFEKLSSTAPIEIAVTNPIKLMEDTTINAKLTLFGPMDLNGKTLTISELSLDNSNFDINGGKVLVNGNLLHMGKEGVYLHGGMLEILGNYTIIYDSGGLPYLKMIHETDYVKIYGNFESNFYSDNETYLTAGVLEVKGDFIQTNYSFKASGTHKVILNGEAPQILSFDGSKFNVLEMNQAAEVTCNTRIYANTLIGFEKFSPDSTIELEVTNPLVLTGTSTIKSLQMDRGTIDLAGQTLKIGSDLIQRFPDTIINLNGGQLFVEGNLQQMFGVLDINGGFLEVRGNYTIDFMDNIADAYLKMTNETDYVKIWGDFLTRSINDHREYLTAGVLEVKENFTERGLSSCFCASGTHKVLLSGEGHQTVTFSSVEYIYDYYNHFNILILTKPYYAGYTFSHNYYLWNYLVQDYEVQKQFGKSGVNAGTGNFSRTYTDFEANVPGLELALSRTYNSRDNRENSLFGRGWTFSLQGQIENLDSNSSYRTVRLPRGDVLSFSLNPDDTYTANDSRNKLEKCYDGTHVLTMKDQSSYGFDTNGRLVQMKDRNGNAINITVDQATGKINAVTDQTGRNFTFSYNTDGLVEQITDPLGRTVNYQYENKQLVKVIDPVGHSTNYSYSDYIGVGEAEQTLLLTKVTDHYNQLIETISYYTEPNNKGKVYQNTDRFGNIQTYTYNTLARETTITDSNSRTTKTRYDVCFNNNRFLDADGRFTFTEYDVDDNGISKYAEVRAITDRNGNQTTYERDERGNITKQINPDGSYQEFTYDEKNNRLSARDEEGKYTYYVYDAAKINLVQKRQPLDGTEAITSYTYYSSGESGNNSSLHGLLKTETDPAGNTTTYNYDQYGNIQTITDPEGKTTTRTTNALGWEKSRTTPQGYQTNYTHDQNGHITKEVQHGGETTRITYDALGRKTREVSPNLYNPALDNGETYSGTHGYSYTYYPHGQLQSITDPEGHTTTYTYDLYSNILTETKPNGAVYEYTYDELNRPTGTSFKENAEASAVLLEETSYQILFGGQTQKTQRRYLNDTETAETTETYDYADRLVTRQHSDGAVETFTYYQNGLLQTGTDARGSTTTYTYDELNRLIAQWLPVEAEQYIYQGTVYDQTGKVIQRKTGKETVALQAIPAEYTTTYYEYYRNGKLQKTTDDEGRITTYCYDADGNLTKEEKYTTATTKNVLESTYNHLGKPVTQTQYVQKGDLFGNGFNDPTEVALLTVHTYDQNGNLLTTQTPDGVTTAYTYDNLNRQTSVSQPGQDENGQAVTITQTKTYNWEGQPLTETDARGNTTTYQYNQRGQLEKTIDPLGGTTALYYDHGGRIIAEVSPVNYRDGIELTNLNRVEYTYDTKDRQLTKTDIYQDPVTNQWPTVISRARQYDPNGNLSRETDALGYETTYTYNLANQCTQELDPVSQEKGLPYTKQYAYDTLGRQISETNSNGIETTFTYDQAGNLLQTAIAGHVVETNTYDFLGNLLTRTDGNGHITEYSYNALGKVRQSEEPGDETIASQITTYQYDEMGNPKKQANSLGQVQLYTYDNQGRVLTHSQGKNDGTETITLTYQYDTNGNKCSETDGNGSLTQYTYDELNRQLTTTKAGQTTSYTYDGNNNRLTETDWLSNTYTNIYDPLNRLIAKKDPNNITIEQLIYNDNNVQTQAIDALGNITQFVYDQNNRLLQTMDPAGHSTSQTYDSAGNIATKTDGNGNTTQYTYDWGNRLLTVTNAQNELTAYTYDLNGNMLTQTDGQGNTTGYQYNARNLLKAKIDPQGAGNPAKTETYTYYADGTMQTKVDRNGQLSEYLYDIQGRLIQEIAGKQTAAEKTISYTYDNNGNQLTMTDSTGATVRTYDELNRVTSKTVPGIGTTTYQYDVIAGVEAGHVAELTTDPQGNITKKIKDKAGRLKYVIADGQTTTYSYYDNGSRASIIYPNGTQEEYSYYSNNQLQSLTNKKADGTIMDIYTYTYDQAGNQVSKHEIINGIEKGTTAYTYDALNRLAQVTEPNDRVTTYTFDAAGNRATETITQNGQTVENIYTYNEQNRLLSITTTTDGTVTETTTYTYDNNGNQLTVTKNGQLTVTNAYDVYNQLISTVTGTTTVTNVYNGEGLRVAKEVNGVTTQYLYEYDKVVLEVDGQGNAVARNVYGLNLLKRTVGNEAYFYLYNGHADVTALINATTGNIAATYYYDAFGNILEQTGAVNNSITYAGYQYDEETGLYYLNARMYDPKIARFLQEDTYRGDINDPLSLNYYVYCVNNPLIYYDPTGHFGEGIANWWNNTKEGWRTLTNKEEREESMRLIAQYGKGKGKNSALLFGSVFGTGSDLLQDPEDTFSTYNREVAKPFITNTLGINENSTGYKALKYIGTRTETGIGVTANLGKSVVQGSYFLGESIGTCLRPYVIESGRSLGLFGLDDDAVYNYAINETNKDIDRIIGVGRTIPGALKSDFFTTFNAENAYNFLFNPNLSFHDSFTYGQSAANTGLLMYATKNLATATGSKIKSGYTSFKNTRSTFMDNMGSQAVAAGAYGNLAGNSAINKAIASSTSRVTSTAKAGLINSIGRSINKGASGEASGLRTWEKAGISVTDAKRIQNAANRTRQEIAVVGSRAKGTATATSDWDYIMSGNSAQRHSAASSLPRGTQGGEINAMGRETGIDIFTNYLNSPKYQPLDPTLPHVVFRPR